MKGVAVIGGGASGMIAAWHAAAGGSQVVLFEKQKKAGRKILVTGNGRCNIANMNLDAARYHGRNSSFVHNVFARFGLEETIDYFRSIGLPLVEENNGKLFPASMQASAVVRVLEYELQRKGVDIHLHRRIDRINPGADGFELITAGNEHHHFGSVILSAGSCAWPGAGASRSGYDLARALGHNVFDPFPAILPLTIPMKSLHRLQGIKWDCAVQVLQEGRKIAASAGELLFTGYGISGPASLAVSRAVNEGVLAGKKTEILIDFFPSFSEEELLRYLEPVLADASRQTAFSLACIIKERMPEFLLEAAGVDPAKKAGKLSGSELKAIVAVLKGLRLVPGDPRGFNDAVVAAGGVDVGEINPVTMESRIVKNLYITGELLDIDGDSGGYNLQFAWSTGALAGMAQAR